MSAGYVVAGDLETAIGEVTMPDQVRIDNLLEEGSDECDRESGIAPRHWGPIVATVTYEFDSTGGEVLRLRDDDGLQYFLRELDTVEVDVDNDGVFEYSWDLADAWLEGVPVNAVVNGGAFTGLRLRGVSTAPETAWAGRVRITATDGWGHAEVPQAVKSCVIVKAHGLSQRLFAGEIVEESLRQASVDARVSHPTYRLPISI